MMCTKTIWVEGNKHVVTKKKKKRGVKVQSGSSTGLN